MQEPSYWLSASVLTTMSAPARRAASSPVVNAAARPRLVVWRTTWSTPSWRATSTVRSELPSSITSHSTTSTPGTARGRSATVAGSVSSSLKHGIWMTSLMSDIRARAYESFRYRPAAMSTTENVAGNTYDKYASTNPIERRMMQGFFDALDTALAGLTPSLVVEVGAGEGHVTRRLVERFPQASVIGLDLPDGELAGEWGELGLPMFFGDATRLPFPDRSVDLVVLLELLEHIPQPDRAPGAAARLLACPTAMTVP